MSWQAVEWVLDRAATKGPGETLVLVAIAEQSNPKGRGAYPSRLTLARRTRLNPASVSRVLNRLRRRGVLTTSPRRGGRGQLEYTIVGCGAVTGAAPVVSSDQLQNVTGGDGSSDQEHRATGTGRNAYPDPSIDPSSDPQEQRPTGAMHGREPDEAPKVLVKLAHCVLDDVDDGAVSESEADDELKVRAARLKLQYSHNRVAKALGAARVQRQRQRAIGRALPFNSWRKVAAS